MKYDLNRWKEWDVYYKQMRAEDEHNRYWNNIDEAVDELISHPLPMSLEETLAALKKAKENKTND